MEKFELAITVLLVALFMICVYIAASWTFWRKQKKKDLVEEWLDKESNAFQKGFVPEGEEGLPKITITPIQPRPDISHKISAPASDTEEDVAGYDYQEIDLGRLYFSLQYDYTRSVLCVRLIRGEDIPMERDISATYVGVRLLPVQLQGEQVQPYETSINVSFQECYEFHLAETDLAQQTLDFHICRYDRFSRKVSIGDVYLALAELGAQGIDISKEVYLCRSLIHSREVYHSDDDRTNVSDGQQSNPQPKVSKPRPAKALSLWKVVQAAVLKGRFHGITQSLGGQDSPFYWESMFSSGNEGENVEGSAARTAPMLYKPSSPEKELEEEQREEEDDEINIDEVVLKAKRSGSFLFPSKSDEKGEDGIEGDQPEVPPASLQISPAPEEYYRLVPFTPFTPASPLKKPKEPNVSWHVPETFTSKGPDVVQALSDTYTDPRIVTCANLRQNKPSTTTKSGAKNNGTNVQKGPPPQFTSTDSDRGRSATSAKMNLRTKKRKREEIRKLSSPPKGARKIVRSTRRHKRKRTGQREEKHDSHMEKHQQRTTNRVFKPKQADKTRSVSSSSDEEFDLHSDKTGQRHYLFKPSSEIKKRKNVRKGKMPESHLEDQSLVFEAKDFSGSSCHYPLKNRAHSAPSDLRENVSRTKRERHETRPSVSMSDVRDSHLDSSELSSD